MSRTLIIAEKPSVATDLSRVLGKLPGIGKFTKKKDYFENENAYISSAVGHLVELKMPLTPEGKKLPWKLDHLPAIPEQFELQPIERNESRYNLLVRLLKKKDVDTVVNACDAGREGELIFRYVLQLAGLTKEITVKRMWMQSMTDNAIMDAWNSMRTDDQMADLADAAMCRSESDWLIGLNATRALTAFNSRNGGFNVTTAGRVQTPTLAILAEREKLIRAFVSEDYWEIHGKFTVEKGEYEGRWFREDFKKDEDNNQKKAERVWTEEEADAVIERCNGKEGVVEETRKPQRQSPERLFDLTSLQREASSKHGFSARRTLQLAQALYDRHKLLTYPRTDSRYLPEDYVDTVKETIGTFAKAKPNAAFEDTFPKCAKWIMDNDRIQPSKRVFDTKKVSDHFAIIPTGKTPSAKLDDDATKIYNLVLRQFLAIFYPPAEFEVTQRITRIGEDCFKTDGKVLVVPGFLEVFNRKPGAAGGKGELVGSDTGETAIAAPVESKKKETRPPARYNDSTLLSAMETAGKLVDDEELRDAMSERGLGTPATRANIIEGLIRQKYLFRDDINRRDLVVSNKGLALFDQLQEIGIETLSSPEMTGDWEQKLKMMEKGELHREAFMSEIKGLTRDIVEQTRSFTQEIINRKFPDLDATCPDCQQVGMKQTDGVFECRNPECVFRLKKHIASHELTEAQARELINNLQVGPIETFKNRFGAQFSAELKLEKAKKVWKVNFVFEGDSEREEELKQLTDDQILCQARVLDDSEELVPVYETEKAYLVPRMAIKKDDRGVRVSKTILQQEISTEQAVKLFVEGKTDLLPDFVSKKKNRKFAAHLTLDRASGKINFEFAPPKKKAAKKKASDAGQTTDEAAEKPKKKKAKKKAAKKKKAAAKSTRKKLPKKKSKPSSEEESSD